MSVDDSQTAYPIERVIVLAAGKPHEGNSPTPVQRFDGQTRALDWTISSLAPLCATPPIVIIGFGADEVVTEYQNRVELIVNAAWQDSNPTESLLLAPLDDVASVLVLYADALFRSDALLSLSLSKGSVSVAYDSSWKNRYAGRKSQDLTESEKVAHIGSRVVRLGAEIPIEAASAEFVGAVKFSDEGLLKLKLLQARSSRSAETSGLGLSGLVESLRLDGVEIEGVEFADLWTQIRDPQDVARFVLGTKGDTLSRLSNAGNSFVVQDQLQLTRGEWEQSSPKELKSILERFGSQKLIVRSNSSEEDTFEQSRAGVFESVPNVSGVENLEQAISAVFASYGEARLSDSVLIQPMVTDIRSAGVCFTRQLRSGSPWYSFNYSEDGKGDTVTSGKPATQELVFVRRSSRELEAVPPEVLPILRAVQEIEKLLAYDSLDIEYAIDQSGIVHIFQVRPLLVETSADNDDVVFDISIEKAKEQFDRLSRAAVGARVILSNMSDWNPAEIIGAAPRALGESLYRYLVTDQTWAIQRYEMGNRDLRAAPLVRSIAGRPYVDVVSSISSFIPRSIDDGLADRLIMFFSDYLVENPHLHDKIEFEVMPTCLDLGFDKWANRLKEAGFSSSDIKMYRKALGDVTSDAVKHGVVANLMKPVLNLEVSQMNRLQRGLVFLEDEWPLLLRQAQIDGVLPFAHVARRAFIATSFLKSALESRIISREGYEGFFSSVFTVSQELARDREEANLDGLILRFGHLRPGTYEITSPAYSTNPSMYFGHTSLPEAAAKPQHDIWVKEKQALLEGLVREKLFGSCEHAESFMRQAIEAREYAKFVFSRNISWALDGIARFGGSLGLSREILSHVPVAALLRAHESDEAASQIRSHVEQISQSEKRRWVIASASVLPNVLLSSSQLDAFTALHELPNFVGSNQVVAMSTYLDPSESGSLPDLKGKIVLIKSADPGFDWVFSAGISGLITEFGGANSHMSIRAAEFGIPGAIGVGTALFQELRRFRAIQLSPEELKIRGVE